MVAVKDWVLQNGFRFTRNITGSILAVFEKLSHTLSDYEPFAFCKHCSIK